MPFAVTGASRATRPRPRARKSLPGRRTALTWPYRHPAATRPTASSTYREPLAEVARAQPRAGSGADRAQPRAPGRADCARAPRPPRPALSRDPPRRLPAPPQAVAGRRGCPGGRQKGSWPISARFTQPGGRPASPRQRFPRSQTPACATVPPEQRKPCLNWPGTRLRPSHAACLPRIRGAGPYQPAQTGLHLRPAPANLPARPKAASKSLPHLTRTACRADHLHPSRRASPHPPPSRPPPRRSRRVSRQATRSTQPQSPGLLRGFWPISLRFTQPGGRLASPPQRFPRSQTPACAAVPPEPRKPCLNWPGTRLRPQRWRSHPEAIPKPLRGPPQHPSGEGTGPLSSASVPGPSVLRPPPSTLRSPSALAIRRSASAPAPEAPPKRTAIRYFWSI